MNDEQFSAIKNAIQIIDDDLYCPLHLEQLADAVGISKYHFHRLFTAITGKPLMAYVRGRKLSASLMRLKNTNLNIIDIANEFQFEHEQSYIRAFKQQFHLTPAQYRIQKEEISVEPKIDINQLQNVGQGMSLAPRVCIKPQFYLQGIQKEIVHAQNLITADANQFAMEFKGNYLPFIHNAIDKNIYIGLVLYREDSAYSNDYIPSVEIETPNIVAPPFVNYTIPLQEYAVFSYIGLHSPFALTYATLVRLYDLIDEWRKETAYVQARPFHFEKMNLKICSDSYCAVEIYLPISTAAVPLRSLSLVRKQDASWGVDIV